MGEREKKVNSERAQRRKETAVIFSKSGGVLFAFVLLVVAMNEFDGVMAAMDIGMLWYR